jgi:hypothetical protein
MVRRGRKIVKAVRSAFAPRSAKLSAYGFGHALGIVSVLALLLYAVMYWFGSYDASIVISQYPLGFSFSDWTIIIGLIETYVLGYIGGWIFAKVYNGASR